MLRLNDKRIPDVLGDAPRPDPHRCGQSSRPSGCRDATGAKRLLLLALQSEAWANFRRVALAWHQAAGLCFVLRWGGPEVVRPQKGCA